MFLYKGWSIPIIFSSAFDEENEILRCLESHHLLQLEWSKWKSLELLEEMAWPNQALPLFGIEWKNLPSFAFVIQTPKFVSFPSFFPPPIFFYLVSPSPRLQVLEKISIHVFPKF